MFVLFSGWHLPLEPAPQPLTTTLLIPTSMSSAFSDSIYAIAHRICLSLTYNFPFIICRTWDYILERHIELANPISKILSSELQPVSDQQRMQKTPVFLSRQVHINFTACLVMWLLFHYLRQVTLTTVALRFPTKGTVELEPTVSFLNLINSLQLFPNYHYHRCNWNDPIISNYGTIFIQIKLSPSPILVLLKGPRKVHSLYVVSLTPHPCIFG